VKFAKSSFALGGVPAADDGGLSKVVIQEAD
jgi:hypothetical protein